VGVVVSLADATHLLRRSGFWVDPVEVAAIRKLPSRAVAIDRVLDISRNPVAEPPIAFTKPPDNYTAWKAMTYWWLDRMRTSPTPIVEKMTLFWHGHFATGLDKVPDMGVLAEQHMTLRKHALGDLHAMAQEISVGPAMLLYLDNWLNLAGKPQENFGRELMELFTMGVGNYTHDDVVAMTRAWTGHTLEAGYRTYRFNPQYHDAGSKTLFGKTQVWDGPAALTEILKGTKAVVASKFIAAKVFSYLAYPIAPTSSTITTIATKFRSSGLDIRTLVEAVFTSTAFWSTAARRAIVRPPIEWFAASLRATGLPASKIPVEALVQAGQVPFLPPDVDGWGSNAYWLSTSQMWGRSRWATDASAHAQLAGVLAGAGDLPAKDAVQQAFDLFGITQPNYYTRTALEAAVTKTKADGDAWLVPMQLVHLLMVSPDFTVN
jgi:uncharacterized protein (DUF1800 family)